jgi:hypothetical protein
MTVGQSACQLEERSAVAGDHRLSRGLVPSQIGDGKYLFHITGGVDKFDDLTVIDTEPFDAFAFYPNSVSVYYLGDKGTAPTTRGVAGHGLARSHTRSAIACPSTAKPTM